MSNVFANKKTAKKDTGVEEDFLSSGGVLDTDVYQATIKTAYLQDSQSSKAQAVNLLLDVNGREVRPQIWVSNKNGDVTYVDKKTKEDKNLPGFNQINSLAMLVLGKELGELDVEELTVKLYDFDAKKELPQAVDCFSELHGEKVYVAIQRQTVDKTKKNDSTGEYEPTGETRDQNEVVKFFAADKMVTISEVEQYIKEATRQSMIEDGDLTPDVSDAFNDVLASGHLLKAIAKMDDDVGGYASKWLEKNKGETYDKSTGKKAAGKEFSGGSGAAAGKAKSAALFDD